MMQRPIEILLVEDNPGDVRLVTEALLEGPVDKRISVVLDGVDAMQFLRRRGRHAQAPRPDLVLLDLNLPRKDGLEVLREIKGDPDLRSITVIMLTTSQSPLDVKAAYEAAVNCYVVKPIDLKKFYQVMRAIEQFWMTVVSRPTDGSPQLRLA